MMKKILLVPLFLFITFFAVSKEAQTDSTYTFRFVSGNDMFYSPWNGNGAELERLLECVENNLKDIQNGVIPIYVEGYCNSGESRAASLEIAKLRANRVKSELIIQKGLKEDCFITKNRSDKGDYVIVRICISPRTITNSICPPTPIHEIDLEEEPATIEEQITETNDSTFNEVIEEPIKLEISPLPETAEKNFSSKLYLRTNLLHLATLTPDIGIEWRSNSGWGILLNGAWTNWTWNGVDRRYALWEVSPEVRYYLGTDKVGYVGANARIGQFNYKFNDDGKQGDLLGAGVTCGYILHLTSSLCLDFKIGIGYTHADYDEYNTIDNVRVRKGNGEKGFWGVNNLGISLVWNID